MIQFAFMFVTLWQQQACREWIEELHRAVDVPYTSLLKDAWRREVRLECGYMNLPAFPTVEDVVENFGQFYLWDSVHWERLDLSVHHLKTTHF